MAEANRVTDFVHGDGIEIQNIESTASGGRPGFIAAEVDIDRGIGVNSRQGIGEQVCLRDRGRCQRSGADRDVASRHDFLEVDGGDIFPRIESVSK